MVTTAIVVVVMWWRQFRSDSLRALVTDKAEPAARP
jgi:uncharacterized membrane protein